MRSLCLGMLAAVPAAMNRMTHDQQRVCAARLHNNYDAKQGQCVNVCKSCTGGNTTRHNVLQSETGRASHRNV